MAKIKIPSVDKDVEQQKLPHIVGGNKKNGLTTLEDNSIVFYKVKHTLTPCSNSWEIKWNLMTAQNLYAYL